MAEYFASINIDEYGLYQDSADYGFTQDSVLLANLINTKNQDNILDLGTGCGIIATLIALKKSCKHITGIELQPEVAKRAIRSVERNNLQDKINIICGDILEVEKYVGYEKFDKVITNPPYFDINSSYLAKESTCKKSTDALNNSEYDNIDDNITHFDINEIPNKHTSRTESTANLDDFVVAGRKTLKFGGDFYIIIKHDRLAELIFLLKQNKLEPKEITYIYPKFSIGIDTVIIRARKGAGVGSKSNSIIVMDEFGEYTSIFKELYS